MKKQTKLERHDVFPIAPSLIKNKYQPILQLYLQFLNYVKSITCNMTIPSFNKVRELNEIEEVFYNETSYDKDKLKFIVKLKKQFVKELLVPALVKDIITAAKKDSSDFEYESWAQLINFCSMSSGTVSRFLLALYDESPSTYIPATSLFAAYQLLNNLKNIKYDTSILKRVYIPKDLLEKHNVKIKDLYDEKSSKNVKNLINEMLKEIRKMLDEAEILPKITKDLLLRMQFYMIISVANILYRKVKNNDVLVKDVTLTKFDLSNAYLTGIIEGMMTSYKDPSTKGLKK